MNNEGALISAVCKNGDIASVTSQIDDKMFESHADVWAGVQSYYHKYHSTPPIEVLEGRFNGFEGVDVKAPTAFYVDRVKEDYLNREIASILITTSKSNDPPEKIIHELQSSVARLGREAHIVRDLNITDYEDAQKYYEDLHTLSLEKGGSPGIMSGFKSMDICYPTGMAGGHFIVMLGYSARGKTWLAGGLAVRAWQQGFKPMFVSLEMTPEAMRDRLYGLMGDGIFSMTELQTGALDIDNFRTWAKKSLVGQSDFAVVSTDGVGDMTVEAIQAKYDEHRPDLIIVDYLQLMGDGKKTGETERIRNVSRSLKNLAVRNNVPVIAISAVTMTDITAVDSPPMLEQVSYSKAIQYDADLALAVHKYDDTNIVEVVARKSRHGELFSFYLDVDLGRGVMRECFDANVGV